MPSTTEDLEIRIAYQDQAIEQMSQQLLEQSRALEQLTQRYSQLEQRIQNLDEYEPDTAADEQPPHY